MPTPTAILEEASLQFAERDDSPWNCLIQERISEHDEVD